jgi:hypothetical protein
MTLDDIKAAILANAMADEICDTLHEVMIAADEDALIEAALPLVVFAYQSGVITDALLAEFTESKLNAALIYTLASGYTINNPTDEVYLMKNATGTINVTGTNRAKVNAMGNSNFTINMSDSSFLSLKVYDSATVTLVASDGAMVTIDATENSNLTITANGSSIVHLNGRNDCTADLTMNNDSYASLKMFAQSSAGFVHNDASQVIYKTYQTATVTDNT